MEPQYQFADQFFIDLDSVPISNIVLVADQRAAEIFFEKIYVHYTECFVLAADRSYPKNAQLRDLIEKRLGEDPKIAIIALSADALQKFKIKSERLLVLDRWIADHYSKAEIRAPFSKPLDPSELIHLIVSFFEQWRLKYRGGNSGFQFRTSGEYDRAKMDWWIDMIAPPVETDGDERLIAVEDSVKLTFFK